MTAIGIDRLGVHVPRWSLARARLAEAWDTAPEGGARTVANFDEDVITMGVEAALAALETPVPLEIDAVLFATTSPVFTEGQHAAVVAGALGYGSALCLDVGGTLRAGLDAILLGRALIESGRAATVLVVAADRRDHRPGSVHERRSGDAAAAVVLSDEPAILTLTGSASIADAGGGISRRTGDRQIRVADERFVVRQLLAPWLTTVAGAACTDAGVEPAALAAHSACAPLSRTDVPGLTRSDRLRQQERELGYCGVAQPFLELASLLTDVAAGQAVLVAAAGDGATAFVGVVADSPQTTSGAAQLARALTGRRPLAVGMFQRMRGQLPVDVLDPFTSDALLRREEPWLLTRTASRCTKCGSAHFPPRRICRDCSSIDTQEPVQLPRTGTLHTLTVEHLFPVPTGELIMGVVDLGPARFYTQITDAAADECAPGVPVELVLRNLHDGGEHPHYFWKAKVA